MIIYSAIYPTFAHLNTLDIVDSWKTVYDPNHIERKDAILILHGGADISPSIYGAKPNKYTLADETPSFRDRTELNLAKKAIEMGVPIFGICRGAQLLCAMNGGKLVQHVTGHHGNHRIETNDGEVIKTNSAHHQMMFPGDTEHELIAWSNYKISKEYLGEDEEKLPVEKEPEIIFFPKIKGLGIQGHPEWLSKDTNFVKYCLKLTEEKLIPHHV